MTSHKDSSSRILWGLLLIIVGLLLLLDRMGRVDFGDLISFYWPLLLVFAGLWHLVANRFRHTAGGLVLIVIGSLFMLGKWHILGRSAWHFVWPILIILAGLWIMFGAFLRGAARKSAGEKANEIDEFAMLAGLTRRLESQDFRGGKATVILGGMELDFSRARLASGQASIEVTAILGGLEIRVPKTWQVHVEGHPVLGSIEDLHSYAPGQEGPQTLSIKATAILAGIEIKDSK
jgi:predicted membrane protein